MRGWWWPIVLAGCNALTGVGDLSVGGDEVGGSADAGRPPTGDAATPGPDAAVPPPPPVTLGPFAYHRAITLSGSGPARPILVVLPPSFTYAHVKANGDDLRFSTTGAHTDELPYFIETWSASGESRVWIRPAAIPADRTLHLFYGNPSAAAASAFGGVFQKVQRGSLVATGSALDVDWFELKAGETLTLPSGGVFAITAPRVILDGTVDGDARGAAGGVGLMDGSGPGGGKIVAASASGGGGYGGAGGTGGADQGQGGAGGVAYGTATGDDVAAGSGGGGTNGRNGGAGGGGISILGWSISGSGTIKANGGAGLGGSAGQTSGGGSGGGILVAGAEVALGSATLTANGGPAGPTSGSAADGGGGGGGGRIKLRHGSVYSAPASMTVDFGVGATQGGTTAPGQNGAPGTIDVAASTALVPGYGATLGPEGV